MAAEQKKKAFPKLQKKIKGFLTDESGKMSKKILGASVIALAVGINQADAATNTCSTPVASHASGLLNGHYSGTPAIAIPASPHCSGWYNVTSPSCSTSVNHASGIVNGHYSGTPSASASPTGHCSHSSY